MSNKPFRVDRKEHLYFSISLVVSVVLYCFLCVSCIKTPSSVYFGMLCHYAIAIGTLLFFTRILLIGHLEGNAVEITKNQLPEVYRIVEDQSQILELSEVPTVYLLQGNGILNAFATRFLGTNYVVIYSDVLEMAFAEGVEAVEFIMAHELGHIKRKHTSSLKKLLLFPS